MLWNLEEHDNKIALITESGSSITYMELVQWQHEFVAIMPARSLVFCLCRNTPGSVVGYIGMINNNAVPVMLDAQIDSTLLRELDLRYQPDFYWIPAEMAERFARFVPCHLFADYVLLKTGNHRDFVLHDDLGLLLTTSGSTGSPKLVRQSYRNIRANAEAIAHYLEIRDVDRVITTLPMSYTYGLSIIHSHLCAGASLVLTEKSVMQKEFWALFRSFEVTAINGVPFTYEMLNKLRLPSMNLPSLRVLTQAGGRLAANLHQKFAQYASETGRRFFVMYGQTEATARMAYLPPEHSLAKCGSIGMPILGGSFLLKDSEGRNINTPDTIGSLVYEGPNVTMGYARQGVDLAKGDEFGGKLVTGDLAQRDSDGFYYIVGREARFLKVYGNRINLDELEHLLKAKWSDADIACTGKDDRIDVYITRPELVDETHQYICDLTHIHRMAIFVHAQDELPKSASGKINYFRLDPDEHNAQSTINDTQ